MAGVIVFTGLLFVSAVLWLGWGIASLLRAGKRAESLIMVSLVFFLLSFIAYAWLRTFGAFRPPTEPNWPLIILGPGLSYLAFLVTVLIGAFFQIRKQTITIWAKVVIMALSLSALTLLARIYGDWLASLYGLKAISDFEETFPGSVMLYSALAVLLAAGMYNRFGSKWKHER
ncbi:MAG TPA: hypothetical protein VFI02_21300 [Armatimonadota bacterium]|nr:hypothetical protein [Armatimonadota bacterium]